MSHDCPIPDSHDRFNESHYNIGQMLENYHNPDIFRFNLNSFLQSLRSVTFILQKELSKKENFDTWYSSQQEIMKQDDLLKKFVEGRNIVVKQKNLNFKSTADLGMFRYKKLKLAFGIKVPIDVDSPQLLDHYKDKIIGTFIDKEHSAIGEEVGIKRKWMVEELGDDEVVSLCDSAWSKIGVVISKAHEFCKFTYEPPPEHGHDIEKASVMVESDIDPSLHKTWGWVE